MDTNQLSNETYKAILTTAARFHEDLELQFGLLSYSCKNDNEYLDASITMINNWLSNKDFEELIFDIFFESPPNEHDFKTKLNDILANIDKVKKIPIEKRHFEL